MKKSFYFLLSSLLFLNVFASENDSTLWSPEFCMSLSVPTSSTISPNGKFIAYTVREAKTEEKESSYLTHIWVAAVDGSFNLQYTRGEKSCTDPSFSPDGTYIGFLSAREEKNQVYRIRLMGGEAEKITFAENGVEKFKWSPEGDRIAFTMKDIESEDEKKLKDEKRDLIFVDRNFKNIHLYVQEIPPAGKNTEKAIQLSSGDFSLNGFDWSPDGKKIVFSHQPEPTINSGFIHSDISIVPSDSGEIVSLVQREGIDRNPLFSPDGKRIAFESNGGKPEAVGLIDIWVVSSSGGEAKMLTLTPDRSARLLSWAVDGKTIYINESIGTSAHLIQVPLKGSDVAILNLGNYVPGKNEKGSIKNCVGTWSGFSTSSKVQAMSFIYQKPELPPQVYYSNLFPYEAKQISKLNSDIEWPEMALTKLMKWKSADGLEIEGLVTFPINYKEGEKYPVILNVHGGPAGVFIQSFTGNASIYLIQYFAEKGYVIIRPNPRGSSGYGKDFRHANVRDWGYGDYEDLLSGVDMLIQKGIADESRQYLMGWSYGGYMTSFMVTRTNRFKAASMGAGLPNLISMTTTTDIPEYLVGHMGGKEFWEDYSVYEKHSAIYNINNVKTPVQVIHGQEDLRVPFTQGQEFYVALKRKGIPTEMIVLPRTPHGPREPKLQMMVSPVIHKWFEEYK